MLRYMYIDRRALPFPLRVPGRSPAPEHSSHTSFRLRSSERRAAAGPKSCYGLPVPSVCTQTSNRCPWPGGFAPEEKQV